MSLLLQTQDRRAIFNRNRLPCFAKLQIPVDIKALQKDYLLLESYCKENNLFRNLTHSYGVDLSYNNGQDYRYQGTMAGSISSYLPFRSIKKQYDYRFYDINFNEVHSWAKDSEIVKFCQSLGEAAKITISCLRPGGFWGSHFDFDTKHGIRLNIPIFTNEKAISFAWNSQSQLLEKINMKEGEIWFVNPGKKHGAVNRGNSDRIYILVTILGQGLLKKMILT